MSVISGLGGHWSVPLASPSTLQLVILAQLLGDVVVAVDQRRRLEDAVDPRLDLGVDRLGGGGRGDEHGGGEQERGFECHGRGLGTARGARAIAGRLSFVARADDEGGDERP